MHEARTLDAYTYEAYTQIAQTTKERVELIFGDIYMMAGATALHQDVVLGIAYALKTISKEKQKCLPRVAPYDLKLQVDGTINVVQPDVMLFCEHGETPCAIFEVLSSSTALKDKTVKKELYEKSGVESYCIVDAEHRVVDLFVLRDGHYVYAGAYGESDQLSIACLEETIDLGEVFEVLAE